MKTVFQIRSTVFIVPVFIRIKNILSGSCHLGDTYIVYALELRLTDLERKIKERTGSISVLSSYPLQANQL